MAKLPLALGRKWFPLRSAQRKKRPYRMLRNRGKYSSFHHPGAATTNHFNPLEPYEEMMERLSKGISTWNFNFGTAESTPEPGSPAGEEISNYNALLSPLTKSRIIPLLPVLAVAFLLLAAGMKGTLWQDRNGKIRGVEAVNLKPQKKIIRMAKVEPLIANGTLEVPISTVEENGLISFEYPRAGRQVPLLAFQNSSGKIETAVGLSWPCNSKNFHIEEDEIVCDLCLTRWDLETLRGLSGDCLDHSLARVTHTIQDGKLMIREADIPRMMRL
jgi:hypothetical protein